MKKRPRIIRKVNDAKNLDTVMTTVKIYTNGSTEFKWPIIVNETSTVGPLKFGNG